MSEMGQRVKRAVDLGIRYGQIEGDHHRLWVIDQMLRILLDSDYDQVIRESNGTDYEWDTGVAP
jgi:hypothetical protein